MSLAKVKVAVVEDNGMARANIRNHLLDMGFGHISCFSNGRELKANLKNQKLDLLLMDFHLGQNKNGVEVIQDLQKQKKITHTTCVMFITSDRLPLIIGQIVDVHPEALVVKPYTIRNLVKNISSCLNLHKYLMPVYEMMDEENYPQALVLLDHLLGQNTLPKKKSALTKLRARLLTKLGRYAEAAVLYRLILERSDKVIWAKWGLIQNLFLDEHIEESETLLRDLTFSELTSVKACEWLARISVNNNQYNKAENYMHQIREGELSIPAARLKAYIYQAQERGKEAITLLEKKRESNRSIRERYDEISLDLARCYITEAELRSKPESSSDLKVAKYLIGAAGRKLSDPSLIIRKDYMFAMIAFMEGNVVKANEILSRPGMSELQDAEISTVTDAVQAWRNAGDDEKAKEFLKLSQEKLKGIEDGNEKTVSGMLVAKGEDAIGERRPQALEFNKIGLQKYTSKQYIAATDDFYQAYLLFPRELAFSLNLLQGLVDAELLFYKKVNTLEFLTELQNRYLNEGNKKRLEEIVSRITKKKDVYFISTLAKDETSQERDK
ncbi:response regulator [Paraglaciecola psychrophila]|uniref:response regulator n=1 Tax=Paraglaciecola psychrophila TaxID=326544 RepID=UPI0002915EC8|nr:response regulator [Paraglaciecola psychrophila]GAC38562.1 response regulator receiver protein [Paraglaciecola psychrophila 170]